MPNFTRITSCQVILESVMKEIGLTAPDDMLGSTDQTVIQLIGLFNSAGQDLCDMADWQMLHKEWTILTTTDTNYPVPEDFNGLVDGAGWSTTQRWPMIGSVTPQIWRTLKARLSGGQWAMVAYKMESDELVLFNAPASGETMILDYYSRGWLRDASDPLIRYDNVQANSDVCLFDSRLIQCLIKLKWRAGKGFDTVATVDEFNSLWDLITGRDKPGMTLSVAQNNTDAELLGYRNIPDTGYGS